MRSPHMRLARSFAVPLAATALLLSFQRAATAVDQGSLTLARATSVGVHNTYDKSTFTYLANALDAGATLIELDVWVNVLNGKWDVSHSSPTSSNNNCVQ